MAVDTKGPELAAFINGIRDLLGLDPLPTNDRHGKPNSRAQYYSDRRASARGEREREARRFYCVPPDASGQTPRRGSGC